MTNQCDNRQRFYIDNSPVRGDLVRLEDSYQQIIAQKDYPIAIKKLLGEMVVSAGLLIGTLKIEGVLSIQLQTSDNDSLLNWAMAECDHEGNIRGLASWQHETSEQQQAWANKQTANDAFMELGDKSKGVLFINMHPSDSHAYQGIVERTSDSLAECLAHYQEQSAQIPTLIKLACDGKQAGGLLLQLLPLSTTEQLHEEQAINAGDDDLWTRLTLLSNTVKSEELTQLESNEILFRLYHQEDVVTPEKTKFQYACTCSREKSESAIIQLGVDHALQMAKEQGGKIELDCGFCGSVYEFDEQQISSLF